MTRGQPEEKLGTYQKGWGGRGYAQWPCSSHLSLPDPEPESHPFCLGFLCPCPTMPLAVHIPQPSSSSPFLNSYRSRLPAAREELSSRFRFRFYYCVPVTGATVQGSSVSLSPLPFRAELLLPTPCGYVMSFLSCRPNRDSMKHNHRHLSVILPPPFLHSSGSLWPQPLQARQAGG